MLRKSIKDIVIVQDDSKRSLDAVVEAIKANIVAQAADRNVPVHVIPSVRLERTLQPGAPVMLIVDTLDSLEVAKDYQQFNTFAEVGIVFRPTDFVGVDPYQDETMKELGELISVGDVVFTDSPLSRFVIDSFLVRKRVQVEIVDPQDRKLTENDLDRSSSDSVNSLFSLETAVDENRRWEFDLNRNLENLPFLTFSDGRWGWDDADPAPRAPGSSQIQESGERLESKRLEPSFLKRVISSQPLRIGIFGHKLSFIDELASSIRSETGSKVILDEWKYLSGPSNPDRSIQLLRDSDVVIGEWARPNNVWLQTNAASDKRLFLRAHRYEVTTDFPRRIDIERFEAAVVIVPWVGRKLVQVFDWPADKMVYIPNYVDNRYFNRRKLAGAEFTLGLVGATPQLKRMDLALELLSRLREIDPRFNLRVRTTDPRKHPHWGSNEDFRKQWGLVQSKLRFDPLLRGAVHFDPPGRNMASWFEQVGVILSPSDLEGSHVALAEGIASGALPVARRWPGIETLWPSDFVCDSFDEACNRILEHASAVSTSGWNPRYSSLPQINSELVTESWWALLNGDPGIAKRNFGEIDWDAPIMEPVPTHVIDKTVG